jgi:hypothetical protein
MAAAIWGSIDLVNIGVAPESPNVDIEENLAVVAQVRSVASGLSFSLVFS